MQLKKRGNRMDRTIKLVEKKIAKLRFKLTRVNDNARYCFENDYQVEYQLWHEQRKVFKNELDIIYKHIKKERK